MEYNGELVLDEVIAFHLAVSERPTAWRSLIQRIDEDGMKIKCRICGEKFKSSKTENFKPHALKHTGERTYKCKMPGCYRRYASLNGLKLHLTVHVGGPTYTCDTCGATFKNATSCYRHTRTHSIVSTFTVEGSENTVFDKEDPYLEDLISFHRYQKIESSRTVELTEVLEEGAERFRCKKCGIKNHKMKQHIAHVVQHTGERPFKCKVINCTTTCATWEDLKEHLKALHFKGNKIMCEICGRKFDTKSLLHKHTSDHHNETVRVFACQYCDATFPKRFKVVNHEKLHKPGNEKLLKCDLCDKQFLNGNGRKFHKVKEHGLHVRPWKDRERRNEFFTCVRCFNSFSDHGLFKAHKQTCSFVVNENFKCRFCSQKFQEQYQYQEHEENFHNDKWKELLIDEMENLYDDFEMVEGSDLKPPSALEMANRILDDATPLWVKS